MTYFFIAGISVALFLFIVLITKRGKQTPDYILAFLLLFGAQTILNTFLIQTDLYLQYPNSFVYSLTSAIMIGPLLFLYVKYQTRAIHFSQKDLLHFLPYITISILYINFYFLLPAEKAIVFDQGGKGFKTAGFINITVIYLSGIIYCSLSLFMLWRFKRNLKNEFSNTERIQFNWLLFLIIGIMLIWVVVLIIRQDDLISFTSTSFILILGYFGISQVNVFHRRTDFRENLNPIPEKHVEATVSEHAESNVELKYQKSGLSERESLQIHKRLKEVLQNEKPYLNPELTLGDLAQLVGAHSNKVSEVINRYEGKTFYDLINELRILEFLAKLSLPESSNYTFTSLAYDCGFNSKPSFNRNFKKYTGKTPSAYLKAGNNDSQ